MSLCLMIVGNLAGQAGGRAWRELTVVVDVRWIVLVAAVVLAVAVCRRWEQWTAPLTVGLAVGTVLYAVLQLG